MCMNYLTLFSLKIFKFSIQNLNFNAKFAKFLMTSCLIYYQTCSYKKYLLKNFATSISRCRSMPGAMLKRSILLRCRIPSVVVSSIMFPAFEMQEVLLFIYLHQVILYWKLESKLKSR